MRREIPQNREGQNFTANDQEVGKVKSKGRISVEKAANIALITLALGLSAACEKAKVISSDALRKFKEKNPTAEHLKKEQLDVMLRAFADFKEAVEKKDSAAVTGNIDLRDTDSGEFAKYSAKLVNNDYIIVVHDQEKEIKERYEKMGISSPEPDGFVYYVEKDPLSGRQLLVIKEGDKRYDLTRNDSFRREDQEAIVDVDTGLVQEALTHVNGNSARYGLEEDSSSGQLIATEDLRFSPSAVTEMVERAEKNLTRVSKQINHMRRFTNNITQEPKDKQRQNRKR